jgi:hypothetical protein
MKYLVRTEEGGIGQDRTGVVPSFSQRLQVQQKV